MDPKPGPSGRAGVKNKVGKTKEKIDPKLDVTSEQFDPIAALYSKTIVLPAPKAKIFDNLNILESIVKRLGTIELKIEKPKPSTTVVDDKKAKNSADDETSGRKFLPHQMLVKGTGPKLRNKRDIIQTLEKGYAGPLGQLKQYMDKETQVKVYIRNNRGIRGYAIGKIAAFDKHWNIAMTDVFESWKRRKIKYTENRMSFGQPTDMSARLKELRVHIPKVTVKSLDRKNVECSRVIPKLIIRGEQVSHVEVMPKEAVPKQLLKSC